MGFHIKKGGWVLVFSKKKGGVEGNKGGRNGP